MEAAAKMSARLRIAAGCAALVALAGWLALGGSRAPSAPPEAAAQPATGPSGGALAPADPSGSDVSDAGGLDDILEEENGELMDVLGVLPRVCGAARRPRAGRLAVPAVEACVADAEAAANLTNLVRESVESPAGADMPGDVRTRWEHTLAGDARTIARALDPVTQTIGQALASGDASPAEVRAFGHLRDRIDRARATLNL